MKSKNQHKANTHSNKAESVCPYAGHFLIDDGNLTYDDIAKAAYIYVNRNLKYNQTLKLVERKGYTIYVDMDKKENVIGYEFLFSGSKHPLFADA